MAGFKPGREHGRLCDKNGRFDYALAAAAEAHDRHRDQARHIASGLTPQAFVEAADRQAGLEDAEDRLQALAVHIEKPGREAAAVACRQMVNAILGRAGAYKLSAPTTRLGYLAPEDARSALAPFTTLELFCLASRQAVEMNPQKFGGCSDMPEAELKLEQLRQERAAAVDALAASWTPEDLDLHESGPPTFKRFPSVEATSRDLGERLLSALLGAARGGEGRVSLNRAAVPG